MAWQTQPEWGRGRICELRRTHHECEWVGGEARRGWRGGRRKRRRRRTPAVIEKNRRLVCSYSVRRSKTFSFYVPSHVAAFCLSKLAKHVAGHGVERGRLRAKTTLLRRDASPSAGSHRGRSSTGKCAELMDTVPSRYIFFHSPYPPCMPGQQNILTSLGPVFNFNCLSCSCLLCMTRNN